VKSPAFLLAGVVAGAALRLLWPEPGASESSLAASGTEARPGAKKSRPTKLRANSAGPAKTADEAEERMKEKLRELGLSPRESDTAPAPSWLYISPPENMLLKSADYVEASIVATEYTVDEQCAPLFAQLRMTPENEARLRRTLAEMVFARHEISALAGADPKSQPLERVREMVAASDEDYRRRLREQLGAPDFARFEAYFATLPEREALRAGFQRVGMLAEPLTPAQRDVIVAARVEAKKGGNASLAIASALTPAQQAAFAQWEIDQLALDALAKITKRNWKWGQGRIRPIYGEPWEANHLR
jgi:hypothetical protein